MTDTTSPTSPLLLVKGDASAEEVAALVAVLQGLSAGGSTGEAKEPVTEWAAPHRLLRRTYPSGPGGWRSSALPR